MNADKGKDAALALRALSMSVPDGQQTRVLLDQVNLDVAAGEVLVITGSSGSGKSTLLALAGLLRRPDSGEVMISGERTSQLSERQRTNLRRLRISIVYQSANLVPSLTAIEQLELVGHINREKRQVARARAEGLLEELGIGDRRNQLPGRMSGGERQRVGIARALMSEPSVLLADEPVASLDQELSIQIAELLASETRSRNLATVIVTHDEVPLNYAHRHLHLDAGHLSEIELAAVRQASGPGLRPGQGT